MSYCAMWNVSLFLCFCKPSSQYFYYQYHGSFNMFGTQTTNKEHTVGKTKQDRYSAGRSQWKYIYSKPHILCISAAHKKNTNNFVDPNDPLNQNIEFTFVSSL